MVETCADSICPDTDTLKPMKFLSLWVHARHVNDVQFKMPTRWSATIKTSSAYSSSSPISRSFKPSTFLSRNGFASLSSMYRSSSSSLPRAIFPNKYKIAASSRSNFQKIIFKSVVSVADVRLPVTIWCSRHYHQYALQVQCHVGESVDYAFHDGFCTFGIRMSESKSFHRPWTRVHSTDINLSWKCLIHRLYLPAPFRLTLQTITSHSNSLQMHTGKFSSSDLSWQTQGASVSFCNGPVRLLYSSPPWNEQCRATGGRCYTCQNESY